MTIDKDIGKLPEKNYPTNNEVASKTVDQVDSLFDKKIEDIKDDLSLDFFYDISDSLDKMNNIIKNIQIHLEDKYECENSENRIDKPKTLSLFWKYDELLDNINDFSNEVDEFINNAWNFSDNLEFFLSIVNKLREDIFSEVLHVIKENEDELETSISDIDNLSCLIQNIENNPSYIKAVNWEKKYTSFVYNINDLKETLQILKKEVLEALKIINDKIN